MAPHRRKIGKSACKLRFTKYVFHMNWTYEKSFFCQKWHIWWKMSLLSYDAIKVFFSCALTWLNLKVWRWNLGFFFAIIYWLYLKLYSHIRNRKHSASAGAHKIKIHVIVRWKSIDYSADWCDVTIDIVRDIWWVFDFYLRRIMTDSFKIDVYWLVL